MQISHYVIEKINHTFNNSHVRRANAVSEVQEEYNVFVSQIDIQSWSKERKGQIEKIAASGDYCGVIKCYNNKGLISIVEQAFGKRDFRTFAIQELKNSHDMQNELIKHLPAELLQAHR